VHENEDLSASQAGSRTDVTVCIREGVPLLQIEEYRRSVPFVELS